MYRNLSNIKFCKMNQACVIVMVELLICMTHYTNSEIRFVCPPPVTPDSNLTVDFFSEGCKKQNFKEYTDVYPGPFTIEYEEPVVIKGSVMRVELYDLERSAFPCTLLDQIPHNDALKVVDPRDCKINGNPIGKCGTSSFITVEIPDIKCDKCALQLRSYSLPSKDATFCHEDRCKSFYSCTNIRIRPNRNDTRETTYNCQNNYRTNILPRWKMVTPRIYEPIDNKNQNPVLFDRSELQLFDNTATDTISYDIILSRMDVDVTSIRVRRHFRATLFMADLVKVGKNHFRGQLRRDKNSKFRGAHAYEGPLLRIRYMQGNQDKIFVTSQLVNIEANIYVPRSTTYTPSGWINNDNAVGYEASYSSGILPRGQCAPPFQQFAASLLNSTKEPAGVITYIHNDFMHISGIFPGIGADWHITHDKGNIPLKNVKNYSLSLAIKEIYYPKSFRVIDESGEGKKSERVLIGSSKKALCAHFYDGNGLHGIATLTLVGKDSYHVEYSLQNFNSMTPPPSQVWLAYPYDTMLLDLTSGIVYLPTSNFQYGVWTTKATFKDSGNELFIRTGHYSIRSRRVNDPNFDFSAQFQVPSDEFCENEDHIFCKASQLKPYDPYVAEKRMVAPSGMISILPSGNRITITGYIQDYLPSDTISAAYFYTDHPITSPLRDPIDFAFTYAHRIVTLKASRMVSADRWALWERGELHVAMKFQKGDLLTTQTITTTARPATTSTVGISQESRTSDVTLPIFISSASASDSATSSSAIATRPTAPRVTRPVYTTTSRAAMTTALSFVSLWHVTFVAFVRLI